MAGTLCIGYDVESGSRKITRAFLREMERIHAGRDVPCSLFIKGQTLEASPVQFKDLCGNSLLDLEQHTYSHLIFKKIRMFVDGEESFVGNDEPAGRVREELERTRHIFLDLLGREPIGLTTPYAFHGGLRDRPDLLQVSRDSGIRFVRSWGRNARGFNPVPIDVQPFFYSTEGFPEILECPVQGWQDCIWRDRFGWNANWEREVFLSIDYIVERDLYLGLVQHDWSSIRADKKMKRTGAIIDYALDRGVRILHYKDLYRERVKEVGR
ncbi:MAG: polysaccharide deacetylase family protein [Promethearchaeota archaeon]